MNYSIYCISYELNLYICNDKIITLTLTLALMPNVNTLPNRQKDEELLRLRLSQLRTRSKKNSRKKKVNFKTKCVRQFPKTPQKRRGRYRSGVSPTFPSWLSHQAGPAAFFHGVIQTIGKTPLTTENVLLTKRRRFQFQLN